MKDWQSERMGFNKIFTNTILVPNFHEQNTVEPKPENKKNRDKNENIKCPTSYIGLSPSFNDKIGKESWIIGLQILYSVTYLSDYML